VFLFKNDELPIYKKKRKNRTFLTAGNPSRDGATFAAFPHVSKRLGLLLPQRVVVLDQVTYRVK